ncbi:hypothetical protein LCGC14_0831770 [marine sediment metagenome]|uniref:Uncharacterized protein n=1 Tax=marine sediment metagenome TaxID=412755 RepID=A0A0F9SMX0_9ZZZZ
MDLQTYLDNAVKVSRQQTLAKSDQLTLGELILRLEPLLQDEKADNPRKVVYDFGQLYPTRIDSWRGIYAELALDFENRDSGQSHGPMFMIDFHKMLIDTVGKTFEGYKGGGFVMSRQTPIWVANHGDSDNTALINVVHDDYQIILITGYRAV